MLEGRGRLESGTAAASRKTLGFLRRKFQPPVPPDPCFTGAGVVDATADLDAWRICLVSAAAGYGKTTLLSQWHRRLSERRECVPLWISLDRYDADPSRFLRALCHCFVSVDGRFADLERAVAAVDAQDDIEPFCIEFVNLSDEACDPSLIYILFLDSYDVAASAGCDDLICFLNQNMGGFARFVIAGAYLRPRIDDLRFASDVMEVSTADLALDEECFLAACEILLPDVPDGEYRRIMDMGGRWPLSIVYYREARKRASGFEDACRVAERYAERFFEHSVMGAMDQDARSLLIDTSLLEELDPALCDEVMGRADSRAVLEMLAERNLYVRHDEREGIFRCEPLFRRYLLHRLMENRADRVDELAQRASEWYAERGRRDEHAKYLALTCDAYYVESSIEGSVGLPLPSDAGSYREYLLFKPASAFGSDAYLAWALVWSCISAGLVDDARYWLDRARGNAPDLPARAYEFADAICLALDGDSAGSLSVIRDLREREGSSMPRTFQCLLVHMEGENCERLGRVQEGRNLYLKAHSLAEREGSSFYKLFDYYLLAQNYFNSGDFEEAEAMARKTLGSCKEGSSLQGGALSVLASILIERHELDEAERVLERAFPCVSPNSNLDMYVDVHLAAARLGRVRGNLIEAFGLASGLVEAVEGKRCPRNMGIRAYVMKAVLAVELGERTALRSCMRVVERFIGDPDVFKAIPCAFAKARWLWAFGRRDECLDSLDSLREPIVACGSSYFLTQLTMLQSSYYAENGDEERGMVELNRALELSMRCGYMSVFLEGRTCIQELLLKLVTGRKASFAVRNYAKEALSLFKTRAEIDEGIALTQGDVQGYYALTEREREVLDKLNAGMSRSEIAASFGISQNTVKSHLKNIYSKLGVHTRSEAYRASERD